MYLKCIRARIAEKVKGLVQVSFNLHLNLSYKHGLKALARRCIMKEITV